MSFDPPQSVATARSDLAIVFSGGGARAAYQVGLLRWLGRKLPNLRLPIITGVSAGAINASFLAAHPRTFADAASELSTVWNSIEVDDVFRTDTVSLSSLFLRWAVRFFPGTYRLSQQVRSLVDTAPLRNLLVRSLSSIDGLDPNGDIIGIRQNLEAGRLDAVALTTVNYGTGQTVTWVQGSDIKPWEASQRIAKKCQMNVDHVMASSALPLFFPAIQIGDAWFGDGGVRLAAPLSPALHLGARRILAISTRYDRSAVEAAAPYVVGYPPPAQILGQLVNAIFLDILDQDAARLERMTGLIEKIPPEERGDYRPLEVVVLRPSEDLGRLSAQFEAKLPKMFRTFTRSFGTKDTKSPDFLSLLMFQRDYIDRLMEIGEKDAEARSDELLDLIQDG